MSICLSGSLSLYHYIYTLVLDMQATTWRCTESLASHTCTQWVQSGKRGLGYLLPLPNATLGTASSSRLQSQSKFVTPTVAFKGLLAGIWQPSRLFAGGVCERDLQHQLQVPLFFPQRLRLSLRRKPSMRKLTKMLNCAAELHEV